ncbi:thioredoxin domain-containing protein [Novosphingobium sp.]|uniref:DsbA family protein n=1 Tax=Novosphingobium sp. TaxID=1874826 RepID=UPI0025E1151A|nr:thioredoxin domain-containing protein [Novosphingobium sp.]
MTKLAALVAVAVLSLAATKPAANWNTAVAVTPAGGHVLGNPAAQIKLTEYVSYTCPHCAHFEAEATNPLRLAYVRTGKVSVEVQHMLRDPIDLTVAMLTNCGTKDKFFVNHGMFMRSQATWIKLMMTATGPQRSRWSSGDLGTRNRSIAADFHFYEMMATRGYDRAAVDRCLTDKVMAERLAKQAQNASELGVTGTPSFAINGALLAGTNEWSVLQPQIDAAL